MARHSDNFNSQKIAALVMATRTDCAYCHLCGGRGKLWALYPG